MDVFLFVLDFGYSVAAMQAGMAGVVVDWEWLGKSERQIGRDTEVNRGTPGDLARMRAAVSGKLICRINNQSKTRVEESRLALEIGADEIWLPMVRDLDVVCECLRVLDGAAELGVLVETREAVRLGAELSRLPLSRVFFGLNDFCVDTQGRTLFDPVVNGTLDRFRESYVGHFGFGGITQPDAGSPVPQRLLLAEMSRLGCDFGVARRSFRADVPRGAIATSLAAIDEEAARLALRDAAEKDRDRARFARAVAADRRAGVFGPSCGP